MPEESKPGSLNSMLSQTAKDDFDQALRKGFWRSFSAWFKGKENRLLPYDEVRRLMPYQGQHYLGMREIPLNKIIGSVGRYQDFDRAFLPRRANLGSRWVSIDIAHLQDVILPPIEVYKIGDAYFVKDGNHRVSVARERHQEEIDAYVIEVDSPVVVDENTNIDDLIRQIEKKDFEQRTRLMDLRPEAKIDLSLPGAYTNLFEHIETHRWFLGERWKRPVSIEEATASWYDEVYMPLIQVIREQGTVKEFPGRTEADLYLWIIEHLWYLREELNKDVSLEDAAHHFTEEFASSPLRHIANLFRQIANAFSEGHDPSITNVENSPEENPAQKKEE
ncbi:transcriptional regulator [Longilinea arvoryzae]|uniref:Transcriptional regulator n=1 Tax=Longilinea arvoryzae TaxID=360412 RepID=A0A0S7BN38_9CHLR|nr:DUF4032 domain-containing protein [Longilinea arvoryzae]GAP15419.1 transcriptional regulator [Longilinea arvoryzae]